MAELALDVLAGVGPDPVGMREIRAPHDLADAQRVEEREADGIRLIRRPALAPPVLARRHRQREVLELIFPLGVHAPENVRDPADARLAEHDAKARIALEDTAVDQR